MDMIEPLFTSNNYQIACKLLDAATLRHEAIAANVANAETPGYRRIDVSPSFATELRASMARGDLQQTAANLQPTLEQDVHARTVRPDGNSVDIEHELLEMNRNSAEHEYLTQVVTYNLKQLKMAITGNNAAA
jgi:flagellar basal-body rod protein FlgB